MTTSSDTVPAFKSRVFLFGADMNPVTVNARWPGSRFIAIARADGVLTKGFGLGANAFGPEIWGIIVETGEQQQGMPLPLALRDGSPATAMLVSDPIQAGSPAEMLAEANYWELPQEYRHRIQAHIDNGAGA